MKFEFIGRLAGAVALTISLAGCMDMTSEIDIQSETSGVSTTTMTMGAEFYPMIKQMRDAALKAGASADESETDFCVDEGDVLVENENGSATCTTVKQGTFDALQVGDDPVKDASFTVVSPGVVRVAFKTEGMASDLGDGEDAQTMAMMKAYFEGHNATLRIKGKKITDTNMTRSGDGKSAEIVIPFTTLLDGTASLPDELFAVVDTR